jgi:hypothetical protein
MLCRIIIGDPEGYDALRNQRLSEKSRDNIKKNGIHWGAVLIRSTTYNEHIL